ncbi:MAG: signal recognition particle-docking protein FtsY [Candidatus Caldarchaeum sp.]|nr:signal recognition particle-docking protein FtsY [Candidatus Caldarchaeum sp.]MDW8359786.1 signal recognition particle-docking protein FtsY [Candidatus Caldarchaeum sp.]
MKGISKAFAGVVDRIASTQLSADESERILSDFYYQLVASDVAVETAEVVVANLREGLQSVKVPRFSSNREAVKDFLKKALEQLIKTADVEQIVKRAEEKKKQGRPVVILFVGPNGSGKTTTVVKIASYLRRRGYTVILASSDTFRAGAIEQLEILGSKAGFLVVSQHYGADPASVAFDAVNKAVAMRVNFVLIDTAGRTEVDRGLLEEMRKIKRVVNPDYVIYTGDALAGNVAVNQARMFHEVVGLDFVVLAKFDADAKGGSTISISHATNVPLLFLGTGQSLEDLDDNPRRRILETLSLG